MINAHKKAAGNAQTCEATDSNTLHYFVFEAGDPVLFNRKGCLMVGDDGCSSYVILGKMEIHGPAEVEREFQALWTELPADPYFKDVPSTQARNRKTAMACHARNDLPEIRSEVFKLLLKKNFRSYAMVRDKRDMATYVRLSTAQEKFRRREDRDRAGKQKAG